MYRVFLFILFTLLAGLYGGSESGAYRVNRIRLRRNAAAGSRLARLLMGIISHMEEFVCMTLVAQNACVYGATLCFIALFASCFKVEGGAELASTLILAPLLLVCVEVVPKSIFQTAPNALMRYLSPLLRLTHIVLWPVVRLLLGVVAFWQHVLGGRRSAPGPVVTSQYLHFFLSEGTQEGVITPQQHLVVRNLMQLDTRPLRRVMVPLAQVQMLSLAASREEALRVIGERPFSRLPLHDDKRDNVVGILVVLDYLCGVEEGSALQQFAREPTRLRGDLPLDDAFRILQKAGQVMGIVVDARERAIGMITVGDLLQEMFSAFST